jgi:hypothetical protein
MISFKQWLGEMVGTGAIYDGTHSPDFNWWGSPEIYHKKNKKKKRKKKKK